ncbi:MAG: GNAT family N-acetyltransferase [Flavobacteriales bacterium]
MEIQQIEHIDDEAYMALVQQFGGIFNSTSWLKIFDSRLVLFGIYSSDNKLEGAFFVYKEMRGPIAFYRTPPFTPHIGLIANKKALNTSKSLSETKKIMDVVATFFGAKKMSLVHCKLPSNQTDTQPFVWHKFKLSVTNSYRIHLAQEIKQIEEHMSPEHRNHLAKAIRDGITCEQTTDYTLVQGMVEQTMSRKSNAVDTHHMQKILFDFATPENSFAFVSKKGELVIGAAFCIFDKETCYYLLGGYHSKERHAGSGILCIYNSILHAKKTGLSTFDFEGSMLPEVEKFFRGFGPELYPIFGFQKAWIPLEILFKFRKRQLF